MIWTLWSPDLNLTEFLWNLLGGKLREIPSIRLMEDYSKGMVTKIG
jgi:hypothetical protein